MTKSQQPQKLDAASKEFGTASKLLENQKNAAKESFQRRLLKKTIEYDALDSRTKFEEVEMSTQTSSSSSSNLLDVTGSTTEEGNEENDLSSSDAISQEEPIPEETIITEANQSPAKVSDSTSIISFEDDTTKSEVEEEAPKSHSSPDCVSSLPTVTQERYVKEAKVSHSFVTREFRPTWWSKNNHFQTIIGTLFRKETMYSRGAQDINVLLDIAGVNITSNYASSSLPLDQFKWDKRERVETDDGDFFDVDWKYADGHNDDDDDKNNDSDNPICLICHGLESCSDSEIAQELAIACNDVNIDAACINFRGCSDSGKECNLTPRGYHLGFTDDLMHRIEEIHSKNPNKRIYLSGFSLGAGVVTKLLADLGEDAYRYNICGAAVNAVPFDSAQCQQNLNEPGLTKLIYGDRLLKSMKRRITQQYDSSGFPFERSKIDECKNIMDIENLAIAPIFGFDDAFDYYDKVKTIDKLPKICVPEYVIQAKDDPFFRGLEWPANDENIPLRIHVTERGGHCGYIFHEKDDEENSKTSWMPTQLARFLAHVEDTRSSSTSGPIITTRLSDRQGDDDADADVDVDVDIVRDEDAATLLEVPNNGNNEVMSSTRRRRRHSMMKIIRKLLGYLPRLENI